MSISSALNVNLLCTRQKYTMPQEVEVQQGREASDIDFSFLPCDHVACFLEQTAFRSYCYFKIR